ncbi:MAG: amidohydrolase family protein [Gemmatimonadales bacterium]|nr:amidohydrolase family protein [Gemmatimonadales bacterium]
MNGPPIRDGALLLDDAGTILAAGPSALVPLPPGAAAVHRAGEALLPGLVNAHTHLELTGLGALDAPERFAEWILELRRRKAARDTTAFLAAAREGVRQCLRAGVTCVADTGDSGAAALALAEAGMAGVAYQEAFGPDPAQRDEGLAFLRERLAATAAAVAAARGRVRLGVSPHAPYSVSGALYRAMAAEGRVRGLPLACHIAESAAESALLRDGTGPFAEGWARRGIAPPPAGRSPVGWLDELGVLGPDLLCIHVVRADATDLDRLAAAGAAVAHCPLSNRRHGHGDAPLAAMLARGLRVGVGTDSEASLGALDLLAEARAASALAGLDALGALALATREAARAIGLGEVAGVLAPGRAGDVAAFPCAAGDETAAAEAVLAAEGPARATWLRGVELSWAGA